MKNCPFPTRRHLQLQLQLHRWALLVVGSPLVAFESLIREALTLQANGKFTSQLGSLIEHYRRKTSETTFFLCWKGHLQEVAVQQASPGHPVRRGALETNTGWFMVNPWWPHQSGLLQGYICCFYAYIISYESYEFFELKNLTCARDLQRQPSRDAVGVPSWSWKILQILELLQTHQIRKKCVGKTFFFKRNDNARTVSFSEDFEHALWGEG